MVEGARLESVYTGNRIAGSNPAPSATYQSASIRIPRENPNLPEVISLAPFATLR